MTQRDIKFSQTQSTALIERAKKSIPGGVNSPVRAFTGVGGTPVFFESGAGSRLSDVDGNSYIDYVGSWGPMILGHSPEHVIDAVVSQAKKALGFGAPTEVEVELAELLCARVPSIDAVRLVSSGCLLYTSPSPRDRQKSRMPSSA